MKKNMWIDCECLNGRGYYIRRGKSLLNGQGVVELLDRLDFLEEERLKLSDNKQSTPCPWSSSCIHDTNCIVGKCFPKCYGATHSVHL